VAAHIFRTNTPREPKHAVLQVWTSDAVARASHGLLAAALALLFLSAAATVEVGFTLQMSYLLAVVAVAAGLPFVFSGWRVLPNALRVGAGALVLIYALLALLGSDLGIPSQPGRSELRQVVYLLDLVVGLSLIGLAVGLTRRLGRLRVLLWALIAGGVAGAAFGVYQWFALRFGLPFSDINTAVNSDGFSRGHRHQGYGLLGWERIRGASKEPLFLASHLAMVLPVALCAGLRPGGRRVRLAGLAASLVIASALVLTVSAMTWGITAACVVASLVVWAVATGRIRTAAVAAAASVVVIILAPLIFTNPAIFAGATGRSSADLEMTSENRTRAWEQAAEVWSRKPIFGHGVGQSAVRLSYRPDGNAIEPGLTAPKVFGSAQGLWAAALIDVGIVGLTAWIALLGTLLSVSLRAAIVRRDVLSAAMFCSGLTAVALTQLSGDRVDLRVWLILAVALALACERRGGERGEGGSQADGGAVEA
jgi:O-antigen ligase